MKIAHLTIESLRQKCLKKSIPAGHMLNDIDDQRSQNSQIQVQSDT